jgi:hypothetical protein
VADGKPELVRARIGAGDGCAFKLSDQVLVVGVFGRRGHQQRGPLNARCEPPVDAGEQLELGKEPPPRDGLDGALDAAACEPQGQKRWRRPAASFVTLHDLLKAVYCHDIYIVIT